LTAKQRLKSKNDKREPRHLEFEKPLKSAKLIRRYKRFLADVELADGSVEIIHCPNTGSMKACDMPGSTIWYSVSDNLKRKYPYTWEIIETPQKHLIGINTHRANKLVAEAFTNQVIKELAQYSDIRSEVKYGGQNSRVDFLLSKQDEQCYIEVKNVTLAETNVCYFPDAVTERGQKHLQELALMKAQGHRAVLLFCVQHTGVAEVRIAEAIDPEYAKILKEVMAEGVEVLCYQAEISPFAITLKNKLPFRI
jgi:sugar fermentation stimulation protein A